MLYQPDAFEPLVEEPWDEASVRDAIARIVADTDAAFDADRLWPANEWDAWASTPPLKALYCGAAGVVWALDELRRKGVAARASTWPPRSRGLASSRARRPTWRASRICRLRPSRRCCAARAGST